LIINHIIVNYGRGRHSLSVFTKFGESSNIPAKLTVLTVTM